MAESLAHVGGDVVSEKLNSLAAQGIGEVMGAEAESELKKLQVTVSAMQDLVLVAEGRQTHKTEDSACDQLGSWVCSVTQAMDSASDLVNELQVEVSRRKAAAAERTIFWSINREVRKMLSRSNSLASTISHVREVRKKLEENIHVASQSLNLNSFVNARRIVDMHVRHRNNNTTAGVYWKPSRKREIMRTQSSSYVGTSDNINIIGRDEDKKNIIQLLIRRSVLLGENVSVLAIVGVGGIGKTTLTKWVYDDSHVAEHFDKRMWVYVSERFDTRKIIKEMIYSATSDKCGNLSLDQLQSRLRNMVDGKKFLLVLDDVWNRDREKWLKLRGLLMGGARGSKIVVTTRKIGVAPIMGTGQTYILRPLPQAESWSLFRKHACIQRLEGPFSDIVDKCGGNPLQLRMLGALMYSGKGEEEWTSVRDDAAWGSEYFPALKLSYHKLPCHLKPCFAFCSIFPKNSEILSDDLVQLWIVHDLIKPTTTTDHRNNNTELELEEIGNQYIRELLERSLFQDFKERDHGACFSVRMHDLVHDLAVSVAQKLENAMAVTFGAKNIPRKIRHVSFSDEDWSSHEQRVQTFLGELTDVQTILFPVDGVGINAPSIITTFIERFKSLRALDLSDSRFNELPDSICSLIKLRYLSLKRNDRIKKLPNSFAGRLTNLEVLMLGGCSQLQTSPNDMELMIKLRHFELTTKEETFPWLQKSFKSPRYLGVVGCLNLKSLFGGWESLTTALRSLFIHSCPSLVTLPRGIRKLSALKILRIDDCETLDLADGDDDDDDDDDDTCLQSLSLLVIVKLPKLETLPKWILQAAAASNTSGTTLQRIVIQSCPNFRRVPDGGAAKFFNFFQKFKIEDCPQATALCPRITKRSRARIFRTHTLPRCKKVGGQLKLLELLSSVKLEAKSSPQPYQEA